MLVFHGLKVGYVGVDVFFVISGYLITTIIINDLDKNKFTIANFYERRARRILPALFFVIIFCIPFAYSWMLPSQFKDFSQAIAAIILFSSNIIFWRKEDYFAPAAEENPLLHTWSLAVEEQFYIVFPLLLMTFWRFGKKPLFYIVVFLSFLSLLLSEWGWRNYPSANFYLLPTRAWELGFGAICSFMLHGKRLKGNQFLSLFGLLLIILSIFVFDASTPFPSLYALIPVVGTVLIICFASTDTIVAKVLSTKVLVGIGLVSFSAYLWHQPLFAFARIRLGSEPGDLVMIVLSIVSILLAFLSWRFVEQPFRKTTGALKNQRQVFTASGIACLAFLFFGLYGWIDNGIDKRLAPSGKTFSELNIDEMMRPNYGLSSECDGQFTLSERCRTGNNPTVALWGDSYAMHLAQAIISSDSFSGELIQFTKSSCSPVVDISRVNARLSVSWAESCIAFNRSVIDWLAQNDDITTVVMSSAMTILKEDLYDSNSAIHKWSDELLASHFQKTLSELNNMGKNVVFVSPTPVTGNNLAECWRAALVYGKGMNCTYGVVELSEQYLQRIDFIEQSGFYSSHIQLQKLLCDKESCNASFGRIGLYRDDGHLSIEGSIALGREVDLYQHVLDKIAERSKEARNGVVKKI